MSAHSKFDGLPDVCGKFECIRTYVDSIQHGRIMRLFNVYRSTLSFSVFMLFPYKYKLLGSYMSVRVNFSISYFFLINVNKK